MPDIPSPEQLEAAAAYEALFVPALFGEWAPRVVDAAQLKPGDSVLDVACGTGALARWAFGRVGASGSVEGVDPHPGMLAVAARLAPAIAWQQGTAEALPYPDQSFDAVVSQFGLMFFADRPRALREMNRTLAPGGRLVIAVWGPLAESPGYADEVVLLERMAGTEAANAVRAPFAMGERATLAALFDEAGVRAPRIVTRQGTARFPSLRTMVEADLRGWLPVMGVVLTEDQIQAILAEAEHVLGAYATGDGTATFPTSAHIVTATKP